jgi:hypothetical protein
MIDNLKVSLMKLRGFAKKILPSGMRYEFERRINERRFGDGYLDEKGWFEGARNRHPVGIHGEPIPWMTYPAIEMLERVIQPSAKIFEFGAGNSSLYWASKGVFAETVEHDPIWADTIKRRAPNNLTVTLREQGENAPSEHREMMDKFLNAFPDLPSSGNSAVDITHGFNCRDFGAYALSPAKYEQGYFDVFVIDGMARSLCAYVASELIAENGIIVFDNSERWQYNPGFTQLSKSRWKRVDFYGPGPCAPYEWCTSIFCRNLDWLPSDLTISIDRRFILR